MKEDTIMEKKQYISPTLDVVVMNAKASLLNGSNVYDAYADPERETLGRDFEFSDDEE